MNRIIIIILLLKSSWVNAQLDSATIVQRMYSTYFDGKEPRPNFYPLDFHREGVKHKHSTQEQSFYEIFFLDYNLSPYQNEEVVIYSVDRKSSRIFFTDSSGKIEAMLPKGVWKVYVKKLGSKKRLRGFAKEWGKPKKLYDVRVVYVYNWDETIALNILFKPGESTIQEKSYHQLDELYEYLHRHPDIRIEIIGHTDNTGNSEANLILSQGRAEAIKAYLVKKGITPHRLVTLGKGDTQPITDNSTEKGRAENRRTEIRAF